MSKHLVQMNISGSTLDKAEKIQKIGDLPNRTTAFKLAVDVAEVVASTLSRGGKIFIEDPTGQKQELLVPGISKTYDGTSGRASTRSTADISIEEGSTRGKTGTEG